MLKTGHKAHISFAAAASKMFLYPREGCVQTNASVTKLPGKTETAKEIALQGNLLHDIPRLLQSEFGIEASFVKVQGKGK